MNWQEQNVEMTMRERYGSGDSLYQKANKDILFKLLWQKPITNSRREVVYSAGSSFPSHISKKLLLEEHKLNKKLEQIEKERRQFLNRNSNDVHMLKLSMRSGNSLDDRKRIRQWFVITDNARYHTSRSDYSDLREEGKGIDSLLK